MEKNRPLISIIVAMSSNRVIGIENRLPWRLPADLKHFKSLTVGKPIVMGRKTWESLPGLLPDRLHIVVTKDPTYSAEGGVVVHSIPEAIAAAGDVPEIMIVGGAAFYEQMIPLADRMYLTLVHADISGDAWFPEYDENQWHEVSRERHEADDRNPYDYTFLTLDKVSH